MQLCLIRDQPFQARHLALSWLTHQDNARMGLFDKIKPLVTEHAKLAVAESEGGPVHMEIVVQPSMNRGTVNVYHWLLHWDHPTRNGKVQL